MADEADAANDLAQKYIDIAIGNSTGLNSASDDCVECSVTIPKARQDATGGTDLCIDCASILELRTR